MVRTFISKFTTKENNNIYYFPQNQILHSIVGCEATLVSRNCSSHHRSPFLLTSAVTVLVHQVKKALVPFVPAPLPVPVDMLM